uniref:Uncharacterized protein n=1 Tax=Branchiostoma floridae TaxID=7739 RepID=C3YP84_BRAFL|eukprot:XP_002601963.1 hypothetical protein BRAFLDRAFT_86448 [Branchiostoma floridae]
MNIPFPRGLSACESRGLSAFVEACSHSRGPSPFDWSRPGAQSVLSETVVRRLYPTERNGGKNTERGEDSCRNVPWFPLAVSVRESFRPFFSRVSTEPYPATAAPSRGEHPAKPGEYALKTCHTDPVGPPGPHTAGRADHSTDLSGFSECPGGSGSPMPVTQISVVPARENSRTSIGKSDSLPKREASRSSLSKSYAWPASGSEIDTTRIIAGPDAMFPPEEDPTVSTDEITVETQSSSSSYCRPDLLPITRLDGLVHGGHLQNMPLRGRERESADVALPLFGELKVCTPPFTDSLPPSLLLQVCAPGMFTAVDHLFLHSLTLSLPPSLLLQWEKLQMTSSERRKIVCSVTFHAIAITCVVWSLYVLIDRTAEEIRQGVLEWPFWTKLVVVAIGFTGGLVFMYVQCKVYVQLWRRLKAYNRVIYVQNCPEGGGDNGNSLPRNKSVSPVPNGVAVMEDSQTATSQDAGQNA